MVNNVSDSLNVEQIAQTCFSHVAATQYTPKPSVAQWNTKARVLASFDMLILLSIVFV